MKISPRSFSMTPTATQIRFFCSIIVLSVNTANGRSRGQAEWPADPPGPEEILPDMLIARRRNLRPGHRTGRVKQRSCTRALAQIAP
jgi:hypothetical protein